MGNTGLMLFANLASLVLLLQGGAGCAPVAPPQSAPPSEDVPQASAPAALGESLQAHGFTRRVDFDATGEVEIRILMAGDESRGAVIASLGDESVILGLDSDTPPDALFQLLAPNGAVLATIFDDAALLEDGRMISPRMAAQEADCSPAALRSYCKTLKSNDAR